MGMNKKWIMAEAEEKKVLHLQKALNIHPVLCHVLVSRGIETFEQAKDFFRPDLGMLHDPFLMKGMREAVNRITSALERKEKIRIYGDYDVDGTTAVAVMYNFLARFIDPELISYYIPNRYTEGYGLSSRGISHARQAGCSLMIVLDCGIRSVELVEEANQLGIDVIICDHHLPGETLPQAVAVLNPKQEHCPYPFKELSGCGIGFKLITALARAWDIPDQDLPYNFLDLVAASIASDIVPIIGENRILAYYGLKKVNENPSVGIRILKEVSCIRGKMNIANLVFFIGPKINAAGRMNDAAKVIRLFTEHNPEHICKIAQELNADNKERITFDKNTTLEALAMMEEPAWQNKKSIVLHHEQWHKGVVGIVASRILEHHYKPTIILTTSNGKITGSARSVHGFDIHSAISACADLLDHYGGHQFAAGVTMPVENLARFQDTFERVVSESIAPESLSPFLHIDAELPLSDIRLPLLKIIEQFEPCGPMNPAPVFVSRGVRDNGSSRIVKQEHLQLHLHQNGTNMKGIAFRMAEWLPFLQSGNAIDIAYHIERNEWNGNVAAEIRVIDIKKSTA